MESKEKPLNIHFIGIGGAGCSALAGWLNEKGHNVTGCDLVINERVRELNREGIETYEGHSTKHLAGLDWVIYTPAAEKTNHPEVRAAKEKAIKTTSYVEALGEIAKHYKTIAVAGAHGKTTTTKMIGEICEKAGLDPNYIVGEGIYKAGNGNLFILEACEYRGHFLNYHPDILVITNIEHDHPDSYGDISDVRDAFKKLVVNVRDGGTVIGFSDDPDVAEVLESIPSQYPNKRIKIRKYGSSLIKTFEAAGWGSKSVIKIKDSEIQLELQIPGKHNVLNSLGAITAAQEAGVSKKTAVKALKHYKTVKRRLEKFAELNGTPLITDWAHHPDQIEAVVNTLRSTFSDQKFAIFFEPHQFQRTFQLFDRFIKCWGDTDYLYILPIYKAAGRETKEALENVSAERLAKTIKEEAGIKSEALSDYKEMVNIIEGLSKDVAAIAFLSAGKLDDFIRQTYAEN